LKKKTFKNPLNTTSIVYFRYARLFTAKFSRTSTIHPGIFGGQTLRADGVFPWMNTIASRDQSKPITIGENLVVNYNCFIIQQINNKTNNFIWTGKNSFILLV